jgi:antitoxin MazE
MKTKVQKWGNSLAVRIPRTFTREIGLEPGASIRMMAKKGALIIVPDREEDWTLETLLVLVTAENIPDEWETGLPRGRESW